jgi:transketolase
MSGASQRAYNVGSEQELSIAELAQRVVRASGTDLPIKVCQAPDPLVPAPRYVPATNKARHELGLAEYTTLDAALHKTIKWNRAAAAHEKFDPKQLRRIILDMAYSGATVHRLRVLHRRSACGSLPRSPSPRRCRSSFKGRDYMVLSKGHGIMAQYACLYELGWLPPADLGNSFQDGTRLKGLADVHVPGVEATAGSLGHGLSVAVGLALAAKLNKTDQACYVLVGDGELNEGPIWEGLLFAAQFKLDNLIVIVDKNDFQAMGSTEEVMGLGDVEAKFAAFGFDAVTLDGHHEPALDAGSVRCGQSGMAAPKPSSPIP